MTEQVVSDVGRGRLNLDTTKYQKSVFGIHKTSMRKIWFDQDQPVVSSLPIDTGTNI